MFEGIVSFFKKFAKNEEGNEKSKDTAKERLHLVLMQDRANVSADFLEMMKQEIIEVIKKYIDVEEKEIDVKLTNKTNEDGSIGAPALYANIPIAKIKNENKIKKIDNEKVVINKNNDSKLSNKKQPEEECKNKEKSENNNDLEKNDSKIIENKKVEKPKESMQNVKEHHGEKEKQSNTEKDVIEATKSKATKSKTKPKKASKNKKK